MRAVRTRDFLYIRNLRPHLWPMGDPHSSVLDRTFADIDASPTKTYIFRNRRDPRVAPFFERCFLKRPEEELYDLRKDPWQLENVAARPDYSHTKNELRHRLDEWMHQTGDPRTDGETDFWDRCPYVTG